MDKNLLKKLLQKLMITFVALFLSFFVGALIILALKGNPFTAYRSLFTGALGGAVPLSVSLMKSVPLILTGLAFTVATKCNVFNIGAEGQYLMGAICAAFLGQACSLPAPLHITLCICGGIAGGLMWAGIAACLKQYRNVHVVISTIMLNYIAMNLIYYLINGPLKDPSSAISATSKIHKTAMLQNLLPRPYALNAAFFIAVLMIIIVKLVLDRTVIGYEMKAVGFNQSAAEVAGIKVAKNAFMALLFSGAIAGLAGALEVQGSIYRVNDSFSSNYGFAGIPVSMMAHGNPLAVFFSAFLIGAMRNGALTMQIQEGISKDLVDIIQGLIIIFIACEHLIAYYLKKMRGRKNA